MSLPIAPKFEHGAEDYAAVEAQSDEICASTRSGAARRFPFRNDDFSCLRPI
jgi:hypothetical protein